MSPIEARTGVALPIWAPGEGKINRHHSYFYADIWENGPRKQETKAVRYSRLQSVRKGPHRIYHESFDGTAFPRNNRQSFGIILFHLVDYVPDYVVDITTKTPEIIETTPAIRSELKRPGNFSIEDMRDYQAEIGQYLMGHSIWQDFSHVKQSWIEEFLELSKEKIQEDPELEQRKIKLGTKLTDIAIGLAADPWEKTFHQARAEQAVREEAPVCAFQVIKNYVTGHERDYFETLENRLVYHTLAA